MCGRYCLFNDTDSEDIRAIMDEMSRKGETIKTGEIFPSDKAPVLLSNHNEVKPEMIAWGFPNFKNKGIIINARSETAEEKPMFRKCLFTKRCVIPSTGFYEWSHDKDKKKYLFNLPGTKAVFMAGLYNEFDGEKRFVILTANANQSMVDVHNRMPLILTRETVNQWILNADKAIYMLSASLPALQKIEV